MAQCSQHSLDVLEGSSEISICPIVAPGIFCALYNLGLFLSFMPAQLQKLVRFMESDCASQDNPPSAAESAVKPSSVASEKSKHAMTPEVNSLVLFQIITSGLCCILCIFSDYDVYRQRP